MFGRIFGATPFKTSPVFPFKDGKGSDVLCVLINPRACGKLCKGNTGLCRTTAVLVPPGRVGAWITLCLDIISGTFMTSPTEDELLDDFSVLPSAEKVKVHYNNMVFASKYNLL